MGRPGWYAWVDGWEGWVCWGGMGIYNCGLCLRSIDTHILNSCIRREEPVTLQWCAALRYLFFIPTETLKTRVVISPQMQLCGAYALESTQSMRRHASGQSNYCSWALAAPQQRISCALAAPWQRPQHPRNAPAPPHPRPLGDSLGLAVVACFYD